MSHRSLFLLVFGFGLARETSLPPRRAFVTPNATLWHNVGCTVSNRHDAGSNKGATHTARYTTCKLQRKVRNSELPDERAI